MERINDNNMPTSSQYSLSQSTNDQVSTGAYMFRTCEYPPANFPSSPPVLSDTQVFSGCQPNSGSSSVYEDNDPISRMIRNLEKSVINEKDEEIDHLKKQLEAKNKEIHAIDEKLTKLVEFTAFSHKQFGNLLKDMFKMQIRDPTNVLCFGPFKSETAKADFIGNLNTMSNQLLSNYESVNASSELFEKINKILNLNVFNKYSANNFNEKSYQVNLSAQKYYSSDLAVLRTSFPINMQPQVSSCSSTQFPVPILPLVNLPVPATLSDSRSVNDMRPFCPVSSIPEMIPLNVPNKSISALRTSEPSLLNRNMRRPQPSISRQLLSSEFGMNLTSANKKHGIDNSKSLNGFFCLCKTRFRNKETLIDHVTFFTMKNFICIICNQRYHKSELLKRHMISSHKLVHVGIANLTCSICHQSFVDRNGFLEHLIKTHGLEDREKSSAGHKREDNRIDSKHAKVVITNDSEQRKFKCICGKVYRTRNALGKHMRTELRGRVFKCTECVRKFFTHYAIKKHMEVIHGVEWDKQHVFGCGICGKTFETRAEHKQHRRILHRKTQ